MSPSCAIEAHIAALRGRRDELQQQRDAVPRGQDPERMADRQARVEELGHEIVALQGIGICARVWEEDQARKLEWATAATVEAVEAAGKPEGAG